MAATATVTLAPELAAALMPDESASAYLRRSAPLPVRTGLWFAPALRPGQAAEFVGPSGSGKTALLVQVRGRRKLMMNRSMMMG
jgi:predicted ABC-type transport system involved in lysophospholipase L1 biosynthesis ATPase subunit